MHVTSDDIEKGMKMMGNPADEQNQSEKNLRKRRRNRYMILSTWGTTLAAFFGFFTIWNHLASASTHSGQQNTASTSSNVFSSSTRTRHHHDDNFGGGDGGSSDDRSSSQSGSAGSGSSFNGNQGGSVNVSPRQTPSFTSRAS